MRGCAVARLRGCAVARLRGCAFWGEALTVGKPCYPDHKLLSSIHHNDLALSSLLNKSTYVIAVKCIAVASCGTACGHPSAEAVRPVPFPMVQRDICHGSRDRRSYSGFGFYLIRLNFSRRICQFFTPSANAERGFEIPARKSPRRFPNRRRIVE